MGSLGNESSLLAAGTFALFSESVGLFLVLLTDLVEPLHVLEEFRASLQGDEKLCFFAISSVVRGLDSDRLGLDFLERSVVVPRHVFKVSKYSKNKRPKRSLNSFIRSAAESFTKL